MGDSRDLLLWYVFRPDGLGRAVGEAAVVRAISDRAARLLVYELDSGGPWLDAKKARCHCIGKPCGSDFNQAAVVAGLGAPASLGDPQRTSSAFTR